MERPLGKKANGALVFVLVPKEGFGDVSQVFIASQSSCMGSGLVCIRWSSDEPCKCRVIFCPAQRRQEVAHLVVHHDRALIACSLFPGWLCSVHHACSVWIM